MGRVTGLGFLMAMCGLAACSGVTPAPSGPDPRLVERCTQQSGFTARADAARASGATGRFYTTEQERAAINACVSGSAGAAPVQPAAPRQTAATVTGGGDSSCLFEPGTTGAYIVTGRSGVPVARRTRGGTQQAVDALNACLQRNAAATGTAVARTNGARAVTETQLADVAGVPQRVETTTSGTTTTQTFTYGTPPSATAPARAGRVPSPVAAAGTASSICLNGGGPMFGGTGYCTRN
jgi:hypothetical protein